MPELDLSDLPQETQDQLAAIAAENGVKPSEGEASNQPRPVVRTAFLVIVQEDGDVIGVNDLRVAANIDRMWEPSADDMYGACSNVMRDISIQMGAGHTVVRLQQTALAAAKQAEEQQLLSKLHLPK